MFFGATVSYADDGGAERTVTIVGVDEADMADGQVSWISPIARALMKTQVGDTVELRSPSGIQTLEVLKIRYEDRAD